MTDDTGPTRSSETGPGPLTTWDERHPLAAFVLLTYAISWTLWAFAAVIRGPAGLVLVVLGGLGPATSAAVLVRRSGRPLGTWLRGLLRWRVKGRYYVYALGLPVALFAVVDLVLVVTGETLDWSLLVERAPLYLVTMLATGILFGGLEEPGWRGHALPLLQETHSPLQATVLVGLAWGVWHVPLYGPAGFVVPLVLAFFYTWLYNRTRSVLLCLLLHASLTAAQDHLVLTADSVTVDVTILLTYVAGAALLVVLTRGRLGFRPGAEPA